MTDRETIGGMALGGLFLLALIWQQLMHCNTHLREIQAHLESSRLSAEGEVWPIRTAPATDGSQQ